MTTHSLVEFYRGKKVLVTGHTGFKGAWLSQVLLHFGARVYGVSLPATTADDLFVVTDLVSKLEHHVHDIRTPFQNIVQKISPDIVFHLAAQPLVRRSYDDPAYTVCTNVMGTVHMLEAIRATTSVRAAVVVTTDKVYKNIEQWHAYVEEDTLGGHDPYSGSKAAADIITQSYITSFFNPEMYGQKHNTLVGVVRAGNVIGGGDWSFDRLIPDIVRAVQQGDGVVTLRNPDAVRPWQHVLDPLTGYLLLGKGLYEGRGELSGAWNFGPDEKAWIPVGEVASRAITLIGEGSLRVIRDNAKHEAGLLMLDSTKAITQLGWKPCLDFTATMRETIGWYTAVHAHRQSASRVTEEQIIRYYNESFEEKKL